MDNNRGTLDVMPVVRRNQTKLAHMHIISSSYHYTQTHTHTPLIDMIN